MIEAGDLVRVRTTSIGFDSSFHSEPLRVREVTLKRGAAQGVYVDSGGCCFFFLDEVEPVTPKPHITKGDILDQAKALITGNREDDYGDAAKNFSDIAALWSVVMGIEVKPWQVAACMTQLKLARAIKTHDHHDSWVDMAGYVGLAGELALNGE